MEDKIFRMYERLLQETYKTEFEERIEMTIVTVIFFHNKNTGEGMIYGNLLSPDTDLLI